MARRKLHFVNGEIYHVYNRSVMSAKIFEGKKEMDFFLAAVSYYMHDHPPVKFSLFRMKPRAFLPLIENKIVTQISYCVMPNHFHFLLRQEENGGIQTFIRKISSSFAHYYGLKHHVHGHLFEGNFQAVHIESNEQLLHVSRYIHLNPVTAYIVENPEDYLYSSYNEYFDKKKSTTIDPTIILSQFRSAGLYKKFTCDQKEYQRDLARMKHMLLDM